MSMTKRYLEQTRDALLEEAKEMFSAFSEDEQGAILFDRFGAWSVNELNYHELEDLIEFLNEKVEQAA